MFDELNQTQMTFPAKTSKGEKNAMKLHEMAKKTHVSFPMASNEKTKKKIECVTGIEFYKDYISKEEKRRNRTQVRKGMRNGAVLLLSNYKPKDFGNA